MTCPFRLAAHRHALALQPNRKPHLLVFDALQLSTLCNVSRPPEPPLASTSVDVAAGPIIAAGTGTTTTASGDDGTVYADAVHGDDSSGTGSMASPFRTVHRALAATRAGGSRSIVLRAGTYHQGDPAEGGPLMIEAQDSGLTLAGAAGERVVLTGGVGLSCGGKWRPVVPGSNVSACPLPSGFSAQWPNITELLVRGKRMVSARFPNNNNPYLYRGWQGGMKATDWGLEDVSQNVNVQKLGPFRRDSPSFPYFESAMGGSADCW